MDYGRAAPRFPASLRRSSRQREHFTDGVSPSASGPRRHCSGDQGSPRLDHRPLEHYPVPNPVRHSAPAFSQTSGTRGAVRQWHVLPHEVVGVYQLLFLIRWRFTMAGGYLGFSGSDSKQFARLVAVEACRDLVPRAFPLLHQSLDDRLIQLPGSPGIFTDDHFGVIPPFSLSRQQLAEDDAPS